MLRQRHGLAYRGVLATACRDRRLIEYGPFHVVAKPSLLLVVALIYLPSGYCSLANAAVSRLLQVMR
jgi:hypothetical protein